eukprot:365283-Chlamydomonas_euryale.AAC.3
MPSPDPCTIRIQEGRSAAINKPWGSGPPREHKSLLQTPGWQQRQAGVGCAAERVMSGRCRVRGGRATAAWRPVRGRKSNVSLAPGARPEE